MFRPVNEAIGATPVSGRITAAARTGTAISPLKLSELCTLFIKSQQFKQIGTINQIVEKL